MRGAVWVGATITEERMALVATRQGPYSVRRISHHFEATSYFRLGGCVDLDNCRRGYSHA
jgi:hypothetical protein